METACFFWSGELGYHEKMSLKSFVKNGFHTKLYSYDNINTSAGVELCDANEIMPVEKLFSFSQGGKSRNLAAFSDVFRMELVCKHADYWWFDLDCYCVKSHEQFKELRTSKPIVIGRDNVNVESQIKVNGAVLSIPDGDIRATIRDNLRHMIDKNNGIFQRWGDAGPIFLENQIKQLGLLDHLCSINHFYSVPAYNHTVSHAYTPKPFKLKQYIEMTSNAYVVHISNECSIRAGVKSIPPAGSYMHQLFSNINDE